MLDVFLRVSKAKRAREPAEWNNVEDSRRNRTKDKLASSLSWQYAQSQSAPEELLSIVASNSRRLWSSPSSPSQIVGSSAKRSIRGGVKISASTDNDDGGTKIGVSARSLESTGSGRKYTSPLGLLHPRSPAFPNHEVVAADPSPSTVSPVSREASEVYRRRSGEAATPDAGGRPPRGLIGKHSLSRLTGRGWPER
ncbi:hypothetical protein THAOC_15556 [Thalassiosira oceanica]|uniref:Uncharacterized protein n=1 Tax=Thalassiosira oceanica TaxID=159749 RepID=K0SEL9_THAOC|nr:hypothetical protein THAOC_15556 [Thalassiosira oceanica]|eukprot:EJK63770.1 hypothetical protein THAOC_15556 [Thalassiosira oceanica]